METLRVCVADDDRDAAEILVQGLIAHGHDAFACYDGESTLRACQDGKADLVLLDVGMPDIDGYEVCRRLKGDASTRELPVVFVTVRGSDYDVKHGFSLGAVDYIVKPYNLPMVMLRIAVIMHTKQAHDMLRATGDPIFDSAYTDHLTGLRNYRYLLERLREEVQKTHRYGHPLSCVLIDVDEFVPVDDELGAAPLDNLLSELAICLRGASRNYDVLARFDGAIFAMVLPHTRLEQALAYAHKVRNEVDGVTFSDPNFPTQAGLSIGVLTCSNGHAQDAEHLLGEAMRVLLRAKSLPDDRIASRDLNAE